MDKKSAIIKEYNNLKKIHPSYTEIAKKTASARSYVARVIQNYKKTKKSR